MSSLALDFQALLKNERRRMLAVAGAKNTRKTDTDAGRKASLIDFGGATSSSILSSPLHRVRCSEACPDLEESILYVPNFLTRQGISSLGARIDDVDDSEWCAVGGRRLVHFGGVPHGSGMYKQDLPEFIQHIFEKLVDFGCFCDIGEPNHVLLNEYDPRRNGSIALHKDGPLYEPCVAILSMGSPCVFEFWKEVQHQKILVQSLLLMPGSLLYFYGAAYTKYWHGIRDRRGVPVKVGFKDVCGCDDGRGSELFVCADDVIPENAEDATEQGSSSVEFESSVRSFGEYFNNPSKRSALLSFNCSEEIRTSLTVRQVKHVKDSEVLETEEFRAELKRRRSIFLQGVSDHRTRTNPSTL